MEQTAYVKQFVNFQKTGLDAMFNAMGSIIDFADATSGNLLSQNETLLKNSQSFVTQWISSVKKGQEEVRASISKERNYNGFELNSVVADQVQSQAEAVTKALFNQSVQLCQKGTQLYNDGLENKKAVLESYKQGFDATFKRVEQMFET